MLSAPRLRNICHLAYVLALPLANPSFLDLMSAHCTWE
jgi:hypothetical protein